MSRIYLDNAATVPMLPEVRTAMVRAMGVFGNASSMHEEGRAARKAIENARAVVAGKINAKPREIIFTSGGSESNNMVFHTMWGLMYRGSERNEIIISSIEHPSVIEKAKFLRSLGYTVHYLPVDNLGRVDVVEYEKALSDKTLFVSIMLANNEIGTIQDIKKLAKLAHKSGALFHTDASQALCKVPIDVRKFDVDYLTLSAHKIGGPKGVGALYIKEGAPIIPFVLGGHQEHGLRAGTENTSSIIGFSSAVKHYKLARGSALRDKLRDGIMDSISDVTINGDQKNCLPNILNVTFAGAEGESILLRLDGAGVSVSTGSACASGEIKPNYVLMAIGADPEKAHGSIRFSFGPENTSQDVNKVLEVLPGIISDLRKMSTIGGENE